MSTMPFIYVLVYVYDRVVRNELWIFTNCLIQALQSMYSVYVRKKRNNNSYARSV